MAVVILRETLIELVIIVLMNFLILLAMDLGTFRLTHPT
jgi:hypothetical protein